MTETVAAQTHDDRIAGLCEKRAATLTEVGKAGLAAEDGDATAATKVRALRKALADIDARCCRHGVLQSSEQCGYEGSQRAWCS
jgi:hypothetical protein